MVNSKLNRQVFSKQDFLNTVDTTFHELGIKTPAEVNPLDFITIDQFFVLYDKLFYDIPKEGEVNSHRFLINESTAYAGADQLNEDIQALLDEIAQLREDLLASNNTIIDLTTQNINTSSDLAAAKLALEQSRNLGLARGSLENSRFKTASPPSPKPTPTPTPTPPPPTNNSTNTDGKSTSSGKLNIGDGKLKI